MKLLLRSILFFAFAGFAPLAFGQETIWNNTGGDGTFETASNWSNGIPTAGTTTFILPGATLNTTNPDEVSPGGSNTITITAASSHSLSDLAIYNTFDTNGPGSVSLTFATGKALSVGVGVFVSNETLNFSGNLNVADAVLVGVQDQNLTNPGPSTFNFSSGTLNGSSAELLIGAASGVAGTFTQSGSATSTVLVGQLYLGTNGSAGSSYTISGSGTNNLTSSGLGSVQIGSGTFTQNDSASTVDFSAGNTQLGLTSGDVAIYNLQAGNLIMKDTILGVINGTTGTINQSGGVFTSTGYFKIGSFGIGAYNFSGGSADFQNGFTVGDAIGSSVTQSGASTLTAEGAVTIGNVGIGTYNMQGGTATFSSGVVLGATGTVNQTGGTFTIASGQALDLSTVGATYTLGGSGILQVPSAGLVGASGEGRLNLSGGTLQITSTGAFTEGLDSTLTGTSTIDAVTTPGITNVTMAGNLTGPGGIALAGTAGTTIFQFAGVNAYTGPTTITSGTLNALATDISHSSALNVGSTGILNLTLVSGGLAYNGALGGPGAVNIKFNTAGDTLAVKNFSSYTGPLTLGANGTPGNFQVFSGSYGNISGLGSGVMVGGSLPAGINGSFATPTSGTVTFGNNSYTGLTTVSSGFTVYASSFGGSVLNNGTLGLVPGSAVGSTLNITGSLSSLNPASGPNMVLAIRADGTGPTPVADLILSSGATTIDSHGTILIIGAGAISTPIPIVTATGGLTLTSPGVLPNVSTSSILLAANLSLGGPGDDSIELTTAQAPLEPLAITPNEMAVAASFDQGIANSNSMPAGQRAAFTTVLSAFDQLTTGSQVASALEELTPESLQYSRMIAFENSTFLAQRVNGVCADLRSGFGGLDTNAISVVAPGFNSGLGRSLGSLLAYDSPAFHQPAPNGVNYYPGGADSTPSSASSPSSSPSSSSSSPSASSSSLSAPVWDSSTQVISDSPNPYMATQKPSGPEAPRMSEFIGGDAILADLNQNQNAANAPSSKASYTTADATAGISFRMASHLAAGVLFDYNHTDAKTDGSGSKTHVDTYSPGLFATYFDHGFYANGLFSFGYNKYANNRDISFLGETATSHPNGQQYVGDVDFGYDFHPDKNWVVGPTLGLTYTHLNIDSFTEEGAPGANLAVDSQSADSLRSRLGGHVIFQTNTGDVLLQPNLTLMWQHEYLDSSSGITSSFNDFSSSAFTINTAAPSRDSALVGCGLTATLNTSVALYLNYLADVGAGDYMAQSVIAGFKGRF